MAQTNGKKENGELVSKKRQKKGKGKTKDDLFVEEFGPPIPPDGGYGWIILVASFLVNVIVDGVCFSFGIFYLEFLDYFGESASKTSWVGSVLNGMYLGMGPIVGALANKFGCRKVAIFGSILSAVAFFISTYSPNVTVLIITYGGLGGMGFGLMYLPAIVMVGYYFEKRRAFATGVAVCGSGIGAFIFAPMCRYLLDLYGWQGATWIIAGIAFNGMVIGALFRPLEHGQRIVINDTMDEPTEEPVVKRKLSYDEKQIDKSPRQERPVDGKCSKIYLQDKISPKSSDLSIAISDKTACTFSLQDLTSPNKKMSRCETSSVDNLYIRTLKSPARKVDKRLRELSNPMYRKDIFYSGSIQNLPEFQKSPNIETYVRNVTEIPEEEKGSKEEMTAKDTGCYSIWKSLKTTMDISLLADPVFLIYGISCFLCMAGFFVPFTYLPPHAEQMGLPKQQGAFLISIIGIANTVARVVCGFISDLPKVDALLLNNIALVIAGVATCCAPLCYNYTLLCIYSAIFGSGIAVFVSLRSILMVELMGLERLTSAFGLVTMFQGLSAFIGAPLAGLLYDLTGDYTYSFYMAGGTLFMAGFICFPLRRLNACLKTRKQEKLKKRNSGMTALLEKPRI